MHQVETVGYLHNQAGGGCDNGGIGLTAVTGDSLDFRVRLEPVNDLLPIAGVEDGKYLPGIVIHDGAHVLVAFPLGEVVHADISAGTHFRVYPAHQPEYPDAGRCTDMYMLHRQRL